MEEKEIDLIIVDEKEKKYILEVPRRIKCQYLKEIIKTKIVQNPNFYIVYINKKYMKKKI